MNASYKYFSLSAVVLAVDLYTKQLVQAAFAYGDSLSINAGGWQKAFFTGVALLAIVVMSYLIQKHRTEKLFCLSLALVIGGAAGNVYDRLTLGYVVDFISLHYQDLYWPAFNVADSAICLGVGLLILDSFKRPSSAK